MTVIGYLGYGVSMEQGILQTCMHSMATDCGRYILGQSLNIMGSLPIVGQSLDILCINMDYSELKLAM